MNSWTTTVFGALIIIGVFAFGITALVLGQPITLQEIFGGLALMSAGGGLIAARDNSRTSEQVGAKTEGK